MLDRAGQWFLKSGIWERAGGVARYYRADLEENALVSTEITGYAVSSLVYLNSLTKDDRYLSAANNAAHFLTRVAWNPELRIFPFEYAVVERQPSNLAYFFDSGIIIRGLLSLWRLTGERELLTIAEACGRSMATDFAAVNSEFHPILQLPDKTPLARSSRWSRSPGCYQLKPAMAWVELHEATGDIEYLGFYESALTTALRRQAAFLAGESDQAQLMDRLHAYCYFLEGLLPSLERPKCRAALVAGISQVESYLHLIEPIIARSDVYAQLLRIRMFAEASGAMAVDRLIAASEIERLAAFQLDHRDVRISGGFYFGRKDGKLIPHINPVSTAFGLQALAMWGQYKAGKLKTPWQALI